MTGAEAAQDEARRRNEELRQLLARIDAGEFVDDERGYRAVRARLAGASPAALEAVAATLDRAVLERGRRHPELGAYARVRYAGLAALVRRAFGEGGAGRPRYEEDGSAWWEVPLELRAAILAALDEAEAG